MQWGTHETASAFLFSLQRLAVLLEPWWIFSLTSGCTFSVCCPRVRLRRLRGSPVARGPQLANCCSTTFAIKSTYWLRRQAKDETIGVTPRTYISKEHYPDGPKTMITFPNSFACLVFQCIIACTLGTDSLLLVWQSSPQDRVLLQSPNHDQVVRNILPCWKFECSPCSQGLTNGQ